MALRVKVIGQPHNPVSLADAKQWLNIDYSDFDQLIQFLIDASVKRSEAVSGCSYSPVTVEVSGNMAKEFVYPIGPVVTEATGDDFKNYTYEAGFTVLPSDLQRAVLQRVATGFAERQNGQEQAINKATEPSYMIETAYRQDLYL